MHLFNVRKSARLEIFISFKTVYIQGTIRPRNISVNTSVSKRIEDGMQVKQGANNTEQK